MMKMECEFEDEVFAAVMQSRWPERTDAELKAHVAGCSICFDVASVASAIELSKAEVQPCLPDAGQVWFKAQMRARKEAIRAAGRPITAAQVLAFACATGLLGACFGATSPSFQAALKAFDPALFFHSGLVIAGLLALVVLVPTALYLAFSRD